MIEETRKYEEALRRTKNLLENRERLPYQDAEKQLIIRFLSDRYLEG